MGEINLSNSIGRDAVVSTDAAAPPPQVRWLDERGRQAMPTRILKSEIGHDYAALLAEHGDPEGVAKALIEGDPELDIETFGSFLAETSRVYIDQDGEMVHRVKQIEIQGKLPKEIGSLETYSLSNRILFNKFNK